MSDARRTGQRGQTLPIVLLLGALLLAGGVGTFWFGRAHAAKADAQAAADLTAISSARRLNELLPAMASAPVARRSALRDAVRNVAHEIARANGVRLEHVVWPEGERWPPTVVQVTVSATGPATLRVAAGARAAVTPGPGGLPEAWSEGGQGQYTGPLVFRDGKPMCPAVAAAFDRMALSARSAGIDLVVVSGFRSDAEQAELFRRHPDPKWVAPPGKSRHRNATELDLGSAGGAWVWLAANASRFGFVQRYSWEPWHYGFTPGCGTAQSGTGPESAGHTELPDWVPVQYRPLVVSGASRGGVPPVVLAALLQAESGYNRWAVSPAGALGIAQFMPETAAGVGLRDPFDPVQAIPAAGRLLGGHLRQFGSVPLALAAYNAGPGAVQRYGGIPPFPETRAYVTRIMALAGDPTLGGRQGDAVTLVRMDALLA